MRFENCLCCLLLLSLTLTHAKIYFKETFDEGWEDRWDISDWRKDDNMAGDWEWTAGKWYGDPVADKGIKTTPDAKFFAISSELEEAFDNEDTDLVVQYSVKHEQNLDCGGGYIKVIPETSKDQMGKKFSGDTPYLIMFGPDICGGTKKVHVILWHNGTNHMISNDIRCKTDELTHVYTLVVSKNNTFKVLIDLEETKSGSLVDDFSILASKTIKDPDAKKPDDWDERKKIPDPKDEKPEGYDDIPEFIVDKDAEKPDDWDEEEDGEWEPPQIKNPDYKGEWKAKMIDNPKYKGRWEAPDIPNPEYVHDDTLYHHPSIKFLGFELWQVKSGSIFDNIMVTDNLDEAIEFGKATYSKNKAGEKSMFDDIEETERAKRKEERSKKDLSSDDDEDDVSFGDDQKFNDQEEEDEDDDDEYYDSTGHGGEL